MDVFFWHTVYMTLAVDLENRLIPSHNDDYVCQLSLKPNPSTKSADIASCEVNVHRHWPRRWRRSGKILHYGAAVWAVWTCHTACDVVCGVDGWVIPLTAGSSCTLGYGVTVLAGPVIRLIILLLGRLDWLLEKKSKSPVYLLTTGMKVTWSR